MLYPKSNKARMLISLEGLWKFRLLNKNEEFIPGTILDSDFEWVAVPASYNDQKEDPAYRRFAGLSVYQKELCVPFACAGNRLVLRFDAVTNAAAVYVGSKEIVRHKGGYLPFEADITEEISEGENFVITVVVDNRIGKSTLPVGNEGGTAFFGSDNAGIPSVEAGKRFQKAINLPNFDFFNYAGINRPVNIYSTPKNYIEDITVVTDIGDDGVSGIIKYEIKTSTSGKLEAVLKNREGEVVAKSESCHGELIVPNAKLWWPYPLEPYLYTFCVNFENDYYELNVGIRTVKVQDRKFLINGKPFYFKGFGKHEDCAIHGRGMDLVMNVKDISLIHWINANSFRTCHYPYAEQMYDLCDREGIVIIDETPAVGIGAGGRNPYEVLDVKEHHKQVIKELIERDKNHPSVVMWSLGNEPDTVSHPEAAYDYWRALYELAHRLDPANRPVTFVCCQNDYTVDLVTRTMDVVCLNRYYGWYNLSGDLEAAAYALNLELDFWEQTEKPVMFTEYGCDTIAGVHNSVPEMFSEEYQAQFLLTYGEAFDKRDFIIGEQLWNFQDFGTIQGPMRPDGNRKGLFTRDRRPKLAAHAMRKRWGDIDNFSVK